MHFFTPSGVRSTSDQMLEMDVRPLRNGVKRPWTPDHLSLRDKISPIGLGCLTHQPIKWSYGLPTMFTRFYLTLGLLEREFCLILRQYSFDLQHKVVLEGEGPCSERIEQRLDFLWSLWAKNGCRIRKHRFRTIDWIQSNLGAHVRRICLEWEGAWDPRSDAKSDANCILSEADWTPNVIKKHL